MVRRNIPLAQQVVQEILTGVKAGNLANKNGLLPSEAELGQRFKVSRATIREALAQLEQRGIIERRHGVGTFLTRNLPVIETGFEVLESIHVLAARLGLKTSCCDIDIAERIPSSEEIEKLVISSEDRVVEVTRIITIETKRVAYLVDVTPTCFLNEQDLNRDFDGSVLDVFLMRGSPALSHSQTDILIEPANKTIAEKLGLVRGSALLKLEARLFAQDGRVVDCSQSYFVPGQFRFRVNRMIGRYPIQTAMSRSY